MLIVLSPAKTLDYESPLATREHSIPEYIDDAKELINGLVRLDAPAITELMGVSEKLAELNVERFEQWNEQFTFDNSRQAVLAFKGDVYSGLDASTLNDTDLAYAQQHLRILSGLYGILRPLDLMQPYRLEMGRKFSTKRGKNLYEFWGLIQTEHLNQLLKEEKTLVNLASNEYFKAVKKAALEGEIITPIFKDFKNGQYKVISFYAKKARGAMARFIIENQISNPRDIKKFDWQGYGFDETLSTRNEWVFCRKQSD